MCEYCEKGRKLRSSNFRGNASMIIWGTYLDIYGDKKRFNIFKKFINLVLK